MNKKCEHENTVVGEASSYFTNVSEFNKAIGTYRAEQVGMIRGQELLLALSLIAEEQHELMQALAGKDLPGLADAIADSIYVLLGLAYRCGIPFDAVWKEVHAANMRKLEGPVREDGKQLKPEGWVGPDIRKALSDG